MWEGVLSGIFIAADSGAPLTEILSAEAVPGRGLKGDRYFFDRGSFSRWPGPHREITLIAEEDLARIKREAGLLLTPAQTRRNLLTRGVPLQQLIKQRFRVGPVELQGVRLCQPCKYLARLLDEPDLVAAMVHKGGLRAQVLRGGVVNKGDVIEP